MVRYIKESIEDDFDDMFDFGDEKAEWYEGGENIPKEYIKGATLLSKEEYEECRNNIPKIDNWWWLQSEGDYNDCVCTIDCDGDFDEDCVYGSHYGIRPALILNPQPFNLEIGYKVDFGGRLFTVISNELAICDDFIGKGCFREDQKAPDANIYEKSDVKKIVDNWFNNAIKNY